MMKIINVTPTVFVCRQEEGLFRRIALYLENDGAAVQATLTCSGITKSISILAGESTHFFLIPEVEADTEIEVALSTDNFHTSARRTIAPAKHWSIHFVPLAHHDLGYSDDIASLFKKYNAYYEDVIRFCMLTDAYPEEAKYRYTVETSWSIVNWLKTASRQSIDRFMAYARAGRIEISALFANIADSTMSTEELVRCLYPTFALKHKYGIPVESASVVDIPGMGWGTPKALADAGVKYYFSGLPTYFEWSGENGIHDIDSTHTFWDEKAVMPNGRPDAMRWTAQDGSSVMLYYQGSYGFFAGPRPAAGQVNKPDFIEDVEGLLPSILTDCESRNVPENVLRFIDHGVDNFPPQINISNIAMEWNKRYAWPKLVVSTNAMFFKELEKQRPTLRELRGEVPHTDYTAAAMGTARETTMNNETHGALQNAETLCAMCSALTGAQYPADKITEAFNDMLLYDEHAYGMSRPFGKLYDLNWHDKARYAINARAEADKLLHAAAEKIALQVKAEPGSHIVTVFNPGALARTDRVRLYNPPVDPAGYKLVDMQSGEEVPFVLDLANDPYLPRPCAAQRYTMLEMGDIDAQFGREIVFIAKDVPPLGYKAYRMEISPVAAPVVAVTAKNMIENAFYRIEASTETGVITSIWDKTDNRELVDKTAEHGFFEVISRHAKNLTTWGHQNAVVHVRESGLMRSLEIRTAVESCPLVTLEVTLWDGIKKIGLSARILNDSCPIRETYIAFPFAVDGAKFRYDGTACVARQFEDQIVGSNTNYHTVQNWVEIKNEDARILLSPANTRVVFMGGMWLCRVSQAHHGVHPDGFTDPYITPADVTKGHLYSLVQHNNSRTNFSMSQSGETVFHYFLTSGEQPAAEFGESCVQPLVPAFGVSAGTGMLPSSMGLLDIDAENITLLAFKKAEDSNGYILRFTENQGRKTDFTAKLDGLPISRVRRCTVVEDNEALLAFDANSIPLSIAAWGFLTIRVETGELDDSRYNHEKAVHCEYTY